MKRQRSSGPAHENGRPREIPEARPRSRASQAARHAAEAKRKVADRRERQSGAAGWVAGRASE